MVDERKTISSRVSQLVRAGSMAAALSLGALAPSAGHAQTAPAAPSDHFNAERMRLALDGQGIIDTEWAAVPEHLSFDLGLWLDYEHNPVEVYSEADGHRYGALLKHRLDGALMGSIGLFGIAQLGLEIPGVLYQSRDNNIPGATAQALPSLSSANFGDIRIQPKIQVLWASSAFLDVALIPGFSLPSAGSDNYAGEKGATFQPELAISKDFKDGFRVSTNLGALFRRPEQLLNESIGNELEARFGIGYRFQEADPSYLPLELDLGVSGVTSAPHPFTSGYQEALELRGEATYHVTSWISVFAGPGWGFGHAYGNPQWRAFAGARFSFGEKPAPVAYVPPPSMPAHVAVIETPPAPPPPAPLPPPPPPEPVIVQAPAPEPIVVASPPHARAKMTAGRIEITEAVEFETGRDVISAKSFSLLDNVAEVMKAHPEMKQFRVEGHTDNAGKPEANLELSTRRAKAVVRYLIGKGVPASELTFQGYGQTKPLADNGTKEGRTLNRRVEFHVVGAAGADFQMDKIETKQK